MQMTQIYPALDYKALTETRSGLHQFAMLLGSYNRAFAPRQRHWWHVSLKPTVDGFTTGVLQVGTRQFELVLDFLSLHVELLMEDVPAQSFALKGESAVSLQSRLKEALSLNEIQTDVGLEKLEDVEYRIDSTQSADVAWAYGRLAHCMARFRSELALETSPIQLWPHHFDLAMLVLTGKKIDGQDPENEELSDEQLNFGFVAGDQGIQEAYFYITFYPDAERLRSAELPEDARFFDEGWKGIVMRYDAFRNHPRSENMLIELWRSAYRAIGTSGAT